jgi:hypothetical protein
MPLIGGVRGGLCMVTRDRLVRSLVQLFDEVDEDDVSVHVFP